MSDRQGDAKVWSGEHRRPQFPEARPQDRANETTFHETQCAAAPENKRSPASDPDAASPSQMLLKAAAYAAKLHTGQLRTGLPDPYINHVIRVAHHAARAGLPEDAVVAALLHDTVEDCGITIQSLIAEGFSQRTIDLVRLLTKDWNKDKS